MLSKETRREVFGFLSGMIAPPLLKGLSWSLRYQVEGEEQLRRIDREHENFLLAFWHGQMLPVLFYFTQSEYDQSRFYTFISPHRDGEYITRAADGLGINALRTSLRDRRLSALKDAIEIARSGHNLAVTPDGPIGPAFEAKDGIIKISRKLELPILPVAALPSRGKFFSSWDHFVLPFPFASLRVAFGEPLFPWRTFGSEQPANQLAEELNQLSRRVAECLPEPTVYRRFLDEANAGS